MTDTNPRKPRTLGAIIDRLLAIRAAGERAATKAAAKARARYVARWDAEMASVPEHLLPAVRSAIAATAGSIEEQEADRWSEEGADAFEPDSPAAEVETEPSEIADDPTVGTELPAGAKPLDPDRAARLERMAGRAR